MPFNPYDEIYQFLDKNNLSLFNLVSSTLRTGKQNSVAAAQYKKLLNQITDLLEVILEVFSDDAVEWALGVADEVYQSEVKRLTQDRETFFFSSTRATLEKLENFSISELARNLIKVAPKLWNLFGLILDANREYRRRKAPVADVANPSASVDAELDGLDMWQDGEDVESDCEDESPMLEENGEVSEMENSAAKAAAGKRPKKKQRRKQDAAKRNGQLLLIRRVLLCLVTGNSTNQHCNALQTVIGFFLESKNVPQVVIEMLSHMGLTTSMRSIQTMHNALAVEAKGRLKSLSWNNIIYDNFDMDFNTGQPTLENRKTHWSATSATCMPLLDTPKEALKVTRELLKHSPNNKDLRPNDPTIYRPSIMDIIPHISKDTANSLDPLHMALAWHMRAILVHQDSRFHKYRTVLGSGPEPVSPLKVMRTKQHPMSCVDSDEVSHDGTARVWEDLLQQRGIDAEVLEEYVIFVHGDLASKERLEGLQRIRKIEATAKNRFAFFVFIPGLFHIKMAYTDAYWRVHLADKRDETSVMEYLHHLRPKETGIFGSGNPGFRKVHDTIHHVTWVDVLDCWRLAARARGYSDLEQLAQAGDCWEVVVSLSQEMVKLYLPHGSFAQNRKRSQADRGMVFENHAIRKQHGLLYLEFCHATNHGDVGRILRLFPYLIAIFRSTGKNKYAKHMIRFMTDLEHVYSKPLRDAILKNWMCNPRGKPDGFRPLDWLMEHNNLYLKVVNAGEGPNRRKEFVMKRSILIDVYRSVHEVIENNFCLTHRTIRHSTPSTVSTLKNLLDTVEKKDPHTQHCGRRAKYQIPDSIVDGFVSLGEDRDYLSRISTGEAAAEVDGQDREREISGRGIEAEDLGVV